MARKWSFVWLLCWVNVDSSHTQQTRDLSSNLTHIVWNCSDNEVCLSVIFYEKCYLTGLCQRSGSTLLGMFENSVEAERNREGGWEGGRDRERKRERGWERKWERERERERDRRRQRETCSCSFRRELVHFLHQSHDSRLKKNLVLSRKFRLVELSFEVTFLLNISN